MQIFRRRSRSQFHFFLILIGLFSIATVAAAPLFADGTRTWEQSKFDDLSKGTATGVAIRSEGGLELAPAFKQLCATPSTYIWAIAADDAGIVYAATGAPARVYRVTPDGKATIIFEPQELQVQTLEVDPGGVIYAATAPDGKVYKITRRNSTQASPAANTNVAKNRDKSPEKDAAKPTLDSSWTSSVFFAPGTKYIWDIVLDKAGNLYVATGDRGEIFKVSPTGEHALFFKSDETHIRALAVDAQGNLIAGTDGSGLVYRISPKGDGFVLYSAPRKEITALALDGDGNIYAAGVGEKRASSSSISGPSAILSLPSSAPAPSAPAAPGLPAAPAISTIQMGAIPIPGAGISGGSDVFKLAPDGSPLRVWTSHDEIVYALAFDSHGQLLAGTGNRGHIFAITGEDDFTDLLKAPASQLTSFARAPHGGLYAASSNLGKIFILGPGPEAEGTYESDVFDAKIFSLWGRAEFRGAGNVELLARTGNVDNPDRNWSPWRSVDLTSDAQMNVPSARYAQWKAVLQSGRTPPVVNSVMLSYLPKNVAPEIDDVTVQVGVRYQSAPKSQASGVSTDVSGSAGIHFDSPVPSTPDRTAIGVKWNAHDENDDQLVYSIYYRVDGETRWLLLKDNLTDKAYSFDSSLLPDGGYTVKVVASDAPSHSPGEGLSTEKASRRFEVDTTPPQIENLKASLQAGRIHVSFRAQDGYSDIKRAEYSVDASDWQYVEPVGRLSDAKIEDYDFDVPLKSPNDESSEHVVVVRVYDKYDNMVDAKSVLRGK